MKNPRSLENIAISISFLVIIVLLLVWMSGCTPTIETHYVTTELHHDPRPVLPAITAKEIECLSQGTIQKLYDRERLTTGYARELEAIIDSTKPVTTNAPIQGK